MPTRTRSFGSGKREGHDSSEYYGRGLRAAEEDPDDHCNQSPVIDQVFHQSSEQMSQLPDASVALMVTSPPYHVGKDYDSETSFEDYLALLRRVFTETYRVLEPGGRAVVNVANLGRRPYIPLSHLVTSLMLEIGYLMRGEVIWQKARGAGGSCAWGSWKSPHNPTFRDVHEYCLCFSRGRFDRARRGTPSVDTETFLAATLSVWEIPSERARRVGHPAPFPVALPQRFIELYTYEGDLVLDPFLGSGSTAVAALRTGRHFIGYDTSEDYVAAARARIAEESALQPPG